MREALVKKVAGEIFVKNSIYSVPVNIESLIKKYDIELIEKDLDDSESGFLVKHKDGAVIVVNKKHPLTRRRFTMAHEFGHFLLHCNQVDEEQVFINKPKTYNRNKISGYGIDSNEVEANLFAAILLMPEENVSEEMDKIPDDQPFEKIADSLAEIFVVSPQAMSIRLEKLGYDLLF